MSFDFKHFRGLGLSFLLHSAKGTTWDDHKYIKRINGTYYYPDSYEGGRHLSSSNSEPDANEKEDNKKKKSETENTDDDENDSGKLELSENDIENLAREVIRGNFGNGQVRKDLLGENYQEIQNRVNEIIRDLGSTKVLEVSSKENSKKGEKITAAVVSSSIGGLDLDKVYSVYRK